MTLVDFRPRWCVGLRFPCSPSVALPPVVDVLSGMPNGVCSPCRHARFGVHPPVQIVCPERTQRAASRAFADRLAASSAAPSGRRCQERQREAKVEGKIKGRGTTLREKPVCTWGWRGTRLEAAPCRVVSQCLISIEKSACFSRSAPLGLDGDAI